MPDAVNSARAMSAERWLEIAAAVDLAFELPPAERAAFVSHRCADDDALRRDVERFLAACEEAERTHTFLPEAAEVLLAPILADLERNAGRAAEAQRQAVAAALAPRYRVERELGRGGMAAVFLAHDVDHDRPVAIKVLRAELTQYIGAERFVREIRITSQLAHPCIVPLLDSGSAGDQLYYVMPYVEGGSLKDRLAREGQLAATDVASLARDIAEALDFAHARGIVHRDIKPQNVLMTDGRAVVADFGIARAVRAAGGDSLTESGVMIGTPAYMSPEQALGERRVDARCDVYALGCVVYEALASEQPYSGATAHSVLAKHLHAPVPDVLLVRPDLGAPVQRVLQRALAKRPADRHASAGEFARELSDALAQPADRKVFPFGPRSRRAWVGTAAIAASGAAVGVAFWGPFRDPPPAVPPVLPRVAVLYLEDRSPHGELTHLASGLTEDLIDALGAVRGLRVLSPDAVRPYAASALPVDSIARLLGASVLVSGSMAADGDRLRVAVRLTDGRTGELIDATPAQEQPPGNVLAIRDSLVSLIVPRLRERLGAELVLRERLSRTRSVAAWELVQLADRAARDGAARLRDGTAALGAAHLARADSLYAQAALADPQWDAPVVGRARVAYARAFSSTQPTTLSNLDMRAALSYAEEAVRRNPRSADAWAMRGQLRHLASLATTEGTSGDSLAKLAEADLTQAIQRRPEFSRALYWLGDVFYTQARYEESLRAFNDAYESDAFLAEVRNVASRLFHLSLHTERFDDAAAWCSLGQKRFAGDPRFTECQLVLLGWRGSRPEDVDEAWRMIYEIERRDSQGVLDAMWAFRRALAAAIIVRAGNPDSARAVLRTIDAEQRTRPQRALSPFTEAWVRLLVGDRERTLALLRQATAGSARERAHAARSPWFKSLHSDPRFREIVGLAN